MSLLDDLLAEKENTTKKSKIPGNKVVDLRVASRDEAIRNARYEREEEEFQALIRKNKTQD